VALDCKRARIRGGWPTGPAGCCARATAIWPDEASLSIWGLPSERLTTTLLDLIEHGPARRRITPT
jgi:hypothetical protein